MLTRILLSLLTALVCFGLPTSACGGSTTDSTKETALAPVSDPAFTKGATELQLESGFELSLQHTHLRVTNFDYELTILRYGYMLDTAHGSNFLRGNDEILLGVEGGPIFHGYGSALGGITALYRRNFLSPGARVVPYFSVGAGLIYSDAYHNEVQQSLGGRFEFIPQAEFGFHFRLTPRWSLDAEFAYRHISDAFITSRNLGTNGVGGSFGVSRSF